MRIYYYLFCIIVCTSCNEQIGSSNKLDEDRVELKEYVRPVQKMIDNPSLGFAHLPRLKSQDGKLYMTWVEQEDSLAILKYSFYKDSTWSQTEIIASGTDWFVNWADFPAIVVNEGTVMATFLQKSAKGTYDYDINYTLRNIETGIWSKPKRLHNDNVPAEHGFVSLLPYKKGFFATWLDGRKTKSSGSEHNSHNHGNGGAMTLRSALISKEGVISKRTELDSRICDCCNTGAAQTDRGLVVVYRDRSEGENETRDIYRKVWIDDNWTAATPVYNDNWKINGCPVNGPSIDAMANTAVTAWFTAANDTPQVNAVFSSDGGLNFGTPIRIDSGEAIGRVDTVMLDDGSALVLWMEPQAGDVLLQLKRIFTDGTSDSTQTITQMSGERISGFPQIEVINKTVFIAFTDVKDEKSKVAVITLAL